MKKIFILFLIFAFLILLKPAYAYDIFTKVESSPIHIDRKFDDKFIKIWVVEAAPSKITMKLENKTLANIESGVILYDKFIQLNSERSKDLETNSLILGPYSQMEYSFLSKEKFVLIIISPSQTTLDKVTISYNAPLNDDLINGAVIAMVGIIIGGLGSTMRDTIREGSRIRQIRNTIRLDLMHLKGNLTNTISGESSGYQLLAVDKLEVISLKIYDELEVEIYTTLPIERGQIRTLYEKIKKVIEPPKAIPSGTSKAMKTIKKTEMDELLTNIDTVIDLLDPYRSFKIIKKSFLKLICNLAKSEIKK